MSDATRFEIATAVRLAESLTAGLAESGSHWRSNVPSLRFFPVDESYIAFVHESGAKLRLFYNQVILPEGPADSGARHYLGNTGRLRPDLTITLHRGEALLGAAVVECKHTQDAGYISSGFHEAMLYRWEYAPCLFGWPKAMLVTSGPVPGAVREQDDVIATTWQRWPPAAAVGAIVEHARRATEPQEA